ncbi:MAG: FxsA family protein [Rubricella sp.]
MWLVLALIAVPLLEIALFIQVGGLIGLLPTLATVVLTALLGAYLLRRQGSGELAKLRRSLDTGEDPTGPIAHGALILVAGVVLLTPGFFTDAVGFALLVPGIRQVIIAYLAKRILTRADIHVSGFDQPGDSGRPDIIDGDYTVANDPDGPPSGWTRGGDDSRG